VFERDLNSLLIFLLITSILAGANGLPSAAIREVDDPVADYLLHPPKLAEDTRNGREQIDTLYRVSVDFQGNGMKYVLLSHDAMAEKEQKGRLVWDVYEPTDGHYYLLREALIFRKDTIAVGKIPGLAGEAILHYWPKGIRRGVILAQRMTGEGLPEFSDVVRKIDLDNEEDKKFVNEVMHSPTSPVEVIRVADLPSSHK
jgi:hypothetical protein